MLAHKHMSKGKNRNIAKRTEPQQRSSLIAVWIGVSLAVVGTALSSWFSWQANHTANQALAQSQEATILATRPRVSLLVSPIDGSNTYCLASIQNDMLVLQYAINYRNVGSSTAVGLDSPAEVWLGDQQVSAMKQNDGTSLSLMPGEEFSSIKLLCVDGKTPAELKTLVQSINDGTMVLSMAFQLRYSPESDKSRRYRSLIRYQISKNHFFYTTREYD